MSGKTKKIIHRRGSIRMSGGVERSGELKKKSWYNTVRTNTNVSGYVSNIIVKVFNGNADYAHYNTLIGRYNHLIDEISKLITIKDDKNYTKVVNLILDYYKNCLIGGISRYYYLNKFNINKEDKTELNNLIQKLLAVVDIDKDVNSIVDNIITDDIHQQLYGSWMKRSSFYLDKNLTDKPRDFITEHVEKLKTKFFPNGIQADTKSLHRIKDKFGGQIEINNVEMSIWLTVVSKQDLDDSKIRQKIIKSLVNEDIDLDKLHGEYDIEQKDDYHLVIINLTETSGSNNLIEKIKSGLGVSLGTSGPNQGPAGATVREGSREAPDGASASSQGPDNESNLDE